MAKMEMGWIKLYGLMKKYLPCAHSTPSSGSNYYQVSMLVIFPLKNFTKEEARLWFGEPSRIWEGKIHLGVLKGKISSNVFCQFLKSEALPIIR